MTSAPPPTAAMGDYATATTTALTPRPWPEFFDTSSLSLPVSFSDASTRLNRNLTHYRVNYAIIASLILIVTLIFHPISLLIIAAIFAAWFFLYFSRPLDVPLEILGFEITDRVLIIVLSVISFVALIFASVWLNLIISVAISVAIVCLHGVLRVPSFGDGDPYGGLLDPTSGAYSEF